MHKLIRWRYVREAKLTCFVDIVKAALSPSLSIHRPNERSRTGVAHKQLRGISLSTPTGGTRVDYIERKPSRFMCGPRFRTISSFISASRQKCQIIAKHANYCTISRSARSILQKNGQHSAMRTPSTLISTIRTAIRIFERSHIGLWIAWSRHILY